MPAQTAKISKMELEVILAELREMRAEFRQVLGLSEREGEIKGEESSQLKSENEKIENNNTNKENKTGPVEKKTEEKNLFLSQRYKTTLYYEGAGEEGCKNLYGGEKVEYVLEMTKKKQNGMLQLEILSFREERHKTTLCYEGAGEEGLKNFKFGKLIGSKEWWERYEGEKSEYALELTKKKQNGMLQLVSFSSKEEGEWGGGGGVKREECLSESPQMLIPYILIPGD